MRRKYISLSSGRGESTKVPPRAFPSASSLVLTLSTILSIPSRLTNTLSGFTFLMDFSMSGRPSGMAYTFVRPGSENTDMRVSDSVTFGASAPALTLDSLTLFSPR